ncbi:MAG TPA: peptide-methionine (S)-S-oxide reductase MsrA [Gaiellaceae bacterium]|nr:peptide-methionine (S)-S-oxide reductase MsrA [Gaiellaceae bacterium]
MTSKATFGAGCFWGVEAAFRRLDGVVATSVGYAGGSVDNPTYEQVCSHRTGHAEVVEVVYDPECIAYEDLLDVFWDEHDATRRSRLRPAAGDQYRSVVFVHGEAQREAAEAARDRLQQLSGREVVTSIEEAPTFWPAEDYHQRYLEKRGLASCHLSLAS